VAEPANHIEGEMLKRLLLDSGIRANLVQTKSGPRLMVQRDEVSAAKSILTSPTND